MPATAIPAVFQPSHPVTLGTCVSRAIKLYTKELGWFVGWGLAVSALKAAMAAATAGWALFLGLFLFVPTTIGLYAIAEAAAHGEEVSFDTVLSGFKLAPAYVLGVLHSVLLIAGVIALVFPMFIVYIGLTWSTAALYRRNLGPVEAVKQSFGMARRNLGLTLGVCLIAFVLDSLATSTVLLGALTAPIMVCLITVAFEQVEPKLDLYAS